MSNYLPDGRVPKTGAIQLGDNRYTITRCVAGGNSLCYFVINETGTHYVIKEFYPSRCAYRKESTDKICAIPGYEMAYSELKRRFQKENEYVNTVRDESYQVASYFEKFYDEEGCALMRPYANDLHPLSALIQEFCDNKIGSMDRLNAAIEIMISLLSALEKLHDTIHIIHFDLSLSNVLYSQSNGQYHVSLMDFGSARECQNGVVSICQKLDIPGSTQEFGAPELAFSNHLTTAADIYSAGIIFYHLITSGIGCYSSETIPPAEVLSRGKNLEMQYGIESLDILPGVKPILFDILCCATWSDPSARFKCGEMLEELKKLKEIVANKGIHREVLLQSSLEKYEEVEAAGFRQYIPALFPEMDMNISGHMLITGDGGSGKSTFFKRLWKKYAANMLQDSSNPIPLYIELNRFTGENKKDFILWSILSTYAPYYADVDNPIQRLKNLFNEGRYLLLLDGMNESTDPQGLMLEIGELAENPNLTICIATRAKPDWEQFEEFKETEIPHLSEEVIQDQLHQADYAPAEGRLLQTLHRPMMTALYLGLGAQKQVQTPGEILLAHHNRLITNFTKVRHEQKYTDLRYFVLDKVFPLFAQRMDSLHFEYGKLKACLSVCFGVATAHNEELGDSVREEWQTADRINVRAILEVLQQTGLLRKSDNGYAYAHQLYQEFYSALAIKQQMEDTNQDPLATQLGQIPIQQPILSMLGDLWGEYNFATKKDLNSKPSKIEDWLQRNMRGKTGPAAQMVVRNLVECMKYSRKNSVTARYDGLDLSLVRFYACRLSKSSFHTAIVSQHSFMNDGHREKSDVLALASKKQLLITAEHEKIYVWDMLTGLIKYTIKLDVPSGTLPTDTLVRFIDISPDEDLFLICSWGYYDIMVYQLDDGKPILPYAWLDELSDIDYERLDDRVGLQFGGTGISLSCFLESKNGSIAILLAFSSGFAYQIDPFSGKQITDTTVFEFSPDVSELEYAISLNRSKLAIRLSDNTFQIIDTKTLKQEPWLCDKVFSDSEIAKIYLTPDGNFLVALLRKQNEWKKTFQCVAICLQTGSIINCNEGMLLAGEIYPYGCKSDMLLYGCQDQKIVHWIVETNSYCVLNQPWKKHDLFLSTNQEKLVFCTSQLDVHVVKPDDMENTMSISIGYTAPYKHNDSFVYSGNNLWMRLTQFHQVQIMDVITKDTITFNCDALHKGHAFMFCNNRFACMEHYLQNSKMELIDRTVWKLHDGKMLKVEIPTITGRTLGICSKTDQMYVCDNTELYIISLAETPPTVRTLTQFWNPKQGTSRHIMQPFSRYITPMCCIIPELSVAVECDRRGFMRAWDLNDRIVVMEQVLFSRGEDTINTVRYVPGTPYVIVKGWSSCYLFDLKRYQKIATWNASSGIFLTNKDEKFPQILGFHELRKGFTELVVATGCTMPSEWDMYAILAVKNARRNLSISGDQTCYAHRKENQHIIWNNHTHEVRYIDLENGPDWNCSQYGLSEHGEMLLVEEDSVMYAYDISNNMLTTKWLYLDVADISNCDFQRATFTDNGKELRNVLKMNGAILD